VLFRQTQNHLTFNRPMPPWYVSHAPPKLALLAILWLDPPGRNSDASCQAREYHRYYCEPLIRGDIPADNSEI